MGFRRLNPNLAIIIGGVASATMFIFYGSYQLMRRVPTVAMVAQQEPSPAEPGITFIVTKLPLARGQIVNREALETLTIAGDAPSEATTTMESVIGKVAIADISAHQLVLRSQVSSDPARAGLSFTVKPGYRAITIRTNDEIAVANFIRPKDLLDISLVLHATALPKQTEAQQTANGDPSEAHTVLQRIEVLAVGETFSDPAVPDGQATRRSEPAKSITVAMTPEQISRFVLARSLGSFYLTLRNPGDAETVVSDSANLNDIRGRTPLPAGPMAQASRPIELVTGNVSKTIYSTSRASQ